MAVSEMKMQDVWDETAVSDQRKFAIYLTG
jgi:hypothetical protein